MAWVIRDQLVLQPGQIEMVAVGSTRSGDATEPCSTPLREQFAVTVRMAA